MPPATGEKESGAFVPPQKLLKAYPQPVTCVPAGQTATEGASEGKQAAFPQMTWVSVVLFDFQRPDWHWGKRANTVSGHQAEKCPYLRWLQVMMRVENTSTRKPIARQENYWFPVVIFFQNGLVVAAGTVQICQCHQHQRMPGKFIQAVVLREERVCVQLHGVPKIERLLRSAPRMFSRFGST